MLDFFVGILSIVAGKFSCLVEIDVHDIDSFGFGFGENIKGIVGVKGFDRSSACLLVGTGLKGTGEFQKDEEGSNSKDVPKAMSDIVKHDSYLKADGGLVDRFVERCPMVSI